MRGIFLSKKLVIALVILIIALFSLTFEGNNKSLGDAEAVLISKMLENEKIREVFNMKSEGIYT